MAAQSSAKTVWEGDLAHGAGVTTPDSGAFDDVDVTWSSRTSRSAGKTSPEELLASAQAACYAMALSHTLTEGGHPPETIDVSATATFDTDAGPKITTMEIDVRARVPGIDEAGFQEAANGAKEGCPVSGALEGNVDIQLSASLEGQ